MKLVSLNTWGATQGQLFFDFIKQQAKNTDIFCFQEVFSAENSAPSISSGARMRLFEELEKMLPDFKGVFLERSCGYDFEGPINFDVKHGLAAYVRRGLGAVAETWAQIGLPNAASDPIEGPVKVQILNLAAGEKQFSVVNYHGPALPGEKLDTPERIRNSEELKVIWQALPFKAKILCGDFNLMPETKSIKILEDCGKNLIKEFKITNTRNEISWKKYHNKQSFADYTFVSAEVKVKSFEAPYNLVSDHLPMILDFGLLTQ